MKKILILTTILIFISLQLAGQQDTLYLRNGSVVYGKIRAKSDTLFRIQTPDGYLFSFSPQEVERYISRSAYEKVIEKPTGLGFSIQSGLLMGSGRESFFLLFSFTPMISYTFNRIHTLSAGSGLEVYDELMLPLFLDYKINFSAGNVTPYFYSKAGILFNLKSDEETEYYVTDYKKGWTCGLGFGVSWPMANFESFLQIGYRYSYSCTVSTDSYYPPARVYTHKINISRFELTWGFKF